MAKSWEVDLPDYFWPCHKPKYIHGRKVEFKDYMLLVIHYCATRGCDNFARVETDTEKWFHKYGMLFGYFCKKCTEERFDGKCTVLGTCIVT